MIGLIALLAADPQLPAGFPVATPATIEDVRADPRRWHDRWVQLSGWMQRCSARDCALTEGQGGQGMSLSFEAAESFDRWVQPLLPAEVVVVARIDSECLLNVCTGRAPMLRQPYVMTKRWNVGASDKDQ